MFTKTSKEASGSEYPHAALDGAVFVGLEESQPSRTQRPTGHRADWQGKGDG